MSYNKQDTTQLFSNSGRPITKQVLIDSPRMTRTEACKFYNSDESLVMDLGRVTINDKKCIYRNFTGCTSENNHHCIFCKCKHRGRNCILRDIPDDITVELYSNSNGRQKYAGKFLPVKDTNNFSISGAKLDQVIRQFRRSDQEEKVQILLNPVLIDALEQPAAQAKHREKLSAHIEELVSSGKKVVLISFDYSHSAITNNTPEWLAGKLKNQNAKTGEINECIRQTTHEISLVSYGDDKKRIVAQHFITSTRQQNKQNGAHLSNAGYSDISRFVAYILRNTNLI